MHITIKAIAAAIKISGLTLMPSVSSSKNLNSPALAAGIGADSLFFFFLLIRRLTPNALALLTCSFSIINLALSFKRVLFW